MQLENSRILSLDWRTSRDKQVLQKLLNQRKSCKAGGPSAPSLGLKSYSKICNQSLPSYNAEYVGNSSLYTPVEILSYFVALAYPLKFFNQVKEF